jgi:hypothetical protein
MDAALTVHVRRLAMMLLVKKVGGLGLLLLGGFIAAHGGSVGYTWEIIAGLILAITGGALLAAKIVRRNSVPSDR